MNRRNDWETMLSYANDELNRFGCEISVYKDEDDYYFVDIKHGDDVEEFSANDFEDELSAIINDAWSYARRMIKPQTIYILTYVGLSESDPDANGYTEVFAFHTMKEAQEKMDALTENEKREVTRMQYTPKVERKRNTCTITWCDTDQAKMEIHKIELNAL